MPRRIAVYGGTFDPLHEGHLRVAAGIVEAFDLERLLLVPAAVPPHKRGIEISSPYHRMAMLALATIDYPRIVLSSIELESPDRPYTIETLGKLQKRYPGCQLFFVMGADSFKDVTSWREYRRILTEYRVIVAVRPGSAPTPNQSSFDHSTTDEMTGHLPPEIRERIIDLRGQLRPSEADLAEQHIYLTDYVAVDISATDVRRAAAEGRPLAGIVPRRVAEYIAKHQLYQSPL